MTKSLFFPKLHRRKNYRRTRSQTYYKNYNEYRQEIREDCLGRCVYCDCHENELGGTESMNLDHFRPQGISAFAYLVNNPHNLVWSCRGCNRLKWSYWPALESEDLVHNDQGFIDPFEQERLDFFEIHSDGRFSPVKPPAHYLIELLQLNRSVPRQRRETRIQSYKILKDIDEQLNRLERQTPLSKENLELIEFLNKNKDIHSQKLDFNLY